MLQKEHTGQEFIYPDKYAGLNVDHRRSASTPEDVVFRDKAAIMIAPYPYYAPYYRPYYPPY
jgi:hypothetical protein